MAKKLMFPGALGGALPLFGGHVLLSLAKYGDERDTWRGAAPCAAAASQAASCGAGSPAQAEGLPPSSQTTVALFRETQ